MLRLISSITLSLCLMAASGVVAATPTDKVVALFDGAMQNVPDLDVLEEFASAQGFRVVSKEMTDDYVSFLETVDTMGELYIVGIRDHREVINVDRVRILVTQYGSDPSYFKALTKQARETLPDGPLQKADLSGGFSQGAAWAANYPGVLTAQISFHPEEKATLIEAIIFHLNEH